MVDFNPEGYNLDDMSSEEKDELIVTLAQEYNIHMAVAVGLYNAAILCAMRLEDGDVFGRRGETMNDVSARLRICAALSLQHMDIDLDQAMVDAAFSDIVADIGEPEQG